MDLYGVDLDDQGPPITPMHDSLRTGRISLKGKKDGPPPVVLGVQLASRMSLLVGDTVTVIAYENLKWSPNGDPVFRSEDWVVSGVFSTGMYDFDLRQGYAALEDVQRLLELDEDVASIVGARADDPWRADALADSVRDALGGWPYVVTSWTEDNRQLFSALKLEKLAMALILSLIVIVAALNIVGTLVMVVVNRTREIGILKAMGLTRRDTLRAFMFQGMWIGVVGTLVGTATGLVLAVLIGRYGLIRLPPEVYFVDRLPVELTPWDITWIAGGSLLISILATIYPAKQASALEPVEAFRHD
ncbi:MAG: ABC transporter permease [Gemmatimonadetes bacterium]|nr:ABC transporter permease [Gemmatimonadota bacterium]